MRQPGEPSVDAILDSIKKVIARDNRAGLAASQHARPDGTDTARADDDVLDLALGARLLPPDDAPEVATPVEGAPLVTPEARAAMRESLATLAMLAEPAPSPPTGSPSDTSIEGLLRELLRPALATWLDRHLPAMVERLVASEIARIVGKKS